MPPQLLLGILWAVAGGLMVARPPEVRVPRLWWWLALGFVGFAAMGFLPRAWVHLPAWRLELEALGLDTGPCAFVQPQLAAEMLVGFAITAVVAVFLLGHRVGTRLHQRLLLAFGLGAGVWTVVALINHEPQTLFGFFPNRNHSATLLVMGAFAGLGCMAQAIRFKQPGKIALAVAPVAVCLFAVFAVSQSRGGMVLVTAGFGAWTLLTGTRHLRGHAGRALALLVAAFVGLFLIMDSPVKSRLTATAERLENVLPAPTVEGTPELALAEAAPAVVELPMDGRVPIFKDTCAMIQHEPWTGVGPGQFARVFPQHREQFADLNDSDCLHPESDWLQMLAETGWPATLCLLAGVGVVATAAIKRAWASGARPLRMASVVAALLLGLHGIFDVPGHRVGLAWAAIVLLALAFRPPRTRERRADPFASPRTRLGWRVFGLVPLLAGLTLLQAQWRDVPVLPSTTVRHLAEQAKGLYDADKAAYDRAIAEGRDYEPPPAADPLVAALVCLDQALRIAPLDSHLHYLRGALALHYDDKTVVVNQAFGIQRRLVPTRINLVTEQARAWLIQNPRQSLTLWQEAMRRAAADEARLPGSRFGILNTYHQALIAAGQDETLAALTLTLAGTDPALLARWALAAPPSLLDRELPRLIFTQATLDQRLSLFSTWSRRGTKKIATNFAKANPELALPSE